jgi:hypothetical protein
LTSVPENVTFHIMWNIAVSGTTYDERPSGFDLVDDVYKILRTRLPSSWKLQFIPRLSLNSQSDQSEFLLEITSQNGTKASIDVEVKRQIDPKDVSGLANYPLRTAGANRFLVVAPYVSPRTRGLLTDSGIGYADATGNLRLELEKPALFVSLNGANSDPWREERPLLSLKGPTAGRVVRALCDFVPPYKIREMAERSNTSLASTSRVVALLDREALVAREERGTVIDVKWEQLIRRWTDDYSLNASNQVRTFLEPRGIEMLLRKLEVSDWPYSVTGSFAAIRVAPIASPRLAVIYVEDIRIAAGQLGLRPVESGTNVFLVQPFDPVVFERTTKSNGITYAALSQVAADLLTGPGRSPAEGEELLKWMGENQDAWRY